MIVLCSRPYFKTMRSVFPISLQHPDFGLTSMKWFLFPRHQLLCHSHSSICPSSWLLLHVVDLKQSLGPLTLSRHPSNLPPWMSPVLLVLEGSPIECHFAGLRGEQFDSWKTHFGNIRWSLVRQQVFFSSYSSTKFSSFPLRQRWNSHWDLREMTKKRDAQLSRTTALQPVLILLRSFNKEHKDHAYKKKGNIFNWNFILLPF